jgi:alginate O-acetyltransferase complex protein AlgJ
MIKLPEKIALSFIIITLLLPIPLTLLLHAVKLSPQFDWIANRTLAGVTMKEEQPKADLGSWMSGELQKGINSLVSEHFAGRELFIRAYDEFLYRAFDKSYMDKEELIDGKHRDLFERDYLADFGHFTEPVASEETEALVVMMKHLSKRLKELGSCFVFVITPSKASLYPEDIPDRYRTRRQDGDPGQSNYEILVSLLRRYEIPYVDGRQITIEHKGSFPVRVFPKTGTHWTRAVAYFTTAALLKTIERESGRAMPELLESITGIDGRPDDVDDDLFSLLNLIERPNERYVHPVFQLANNWPKRKGILTFVGGSFVGQMKNNLEAAEVFQQINYYFYFNLYKRKSPGNIVSPVDENAIPWAEDFWNSQAVVLEANEQAIGGRHLRAFLMDALTALEQKLPQERETDDHPLRPFCWTFGAEGNGASLPKKGFEVPDHEFTWISSREAEIEAPSPQPNAELELILEAIPFLGDGESRRIVKVEANGIPAGTLTLDDPSVQFYSLRLPVAANHNSSIKLRFSSSLPASRAKGGKLVEMGLARLALVPTNVSFSQQMAENEAAVLHRK